MPPKLVHTTKSTYSIFTATLAPNVNRYLAPGTSLEHLKIFSQVRHRILHAVIIDLRFFFSIKNDRHVFIHIYNVTL